MPLEAEHRQRAVHNAEIAEKIRSSCPEFCDWAVIALFYSALHMLEGYLAKLDEHPEGHASRAQAFQDHSTLAPIWDDYRILKDYSEDARYWCGEFSTDEIKELQDGEHRRITEFFSRL